MEFLFEILFCNINITIGSNNIRIEINKCSNMLAIYKITCKGAPNDNILKAKIPAIKNIEKQRELRMIFKSFTITDNLFVFFHKFFIKRNSIVIKVKKIPRINLINKKYNEVC